MVALYWVLNFLFTCHQRRRHRGWGTYWFISEVLPTLHVKGLREGGRAVPAVTEDDDLEQGFPSRSGHCGDQRATTMDVEVLG
jgi:hypothetical protein